MNRHRWKGKLMTTKEIARDTGRSVSAVQSWMRECQGDEECFQRKVDEAAGAIDRKGPPSTANRFKEKAIGELGPRKKIEELGHLDPPDYERKLWREK